MIAWAVTPVAGGPFEGELDGPAWDGRALLFCNATKNEIWKYDDANGAASLVRTQTVRTRGLAFAPDGRLYGAQTRARRIVWYRDDGASYYVESTIDGLRRNDPLHLAVDRAGRIWSTDRWTEESSGGPVGYPALPHRSVLRLEPSGPREANAVGAWTVRRMTHDTTSPHGVALSPDERTLYLSDDGDEMTPPTLRAYAVAGDGVADRGTVLRRYAPGDGPAGIAVAASGRIVVTAGALGSTGGPRIEVVEPDGRIASTSPITDGAPTACGFGGVALDLLFVTTAAGQLLRIEGTGLRGYSPR
jgi:gluconolactonase